MKETLVREATGIRRHRLRALFAEAIKGTLRSRLLEPHESVRQGSTLHALSVREDEPDKRLVNAGGTAGM